MPGKKNNDLRKKVKPGLVLQMKARIKLRPGSRIHRDDVADKKTRVLTGFGTEDSHHSLHDFVWTPDGDLIFRESILYFCDFYLRLKGCDLRQLYRTFLLLISVPLLLSLAKVYFLQLIYPSGMHSI